ncbi:MAG TPA: hypothetical protein VMU75_06500 [Acidimicrobiales bacterium]|nr:hypothetical protein [Acidimicrobiales bacterium]
MRRHRSLDIVRAEHELSAQLHPGEPVLLCSAGTLGLYADGRRVTLACLVFATDRRIGVLPAAAPGAPRLVEFDYDALTAIGCARGLRSAQVSLTSPAAEAVVRSLRRDVAEDLVHLVGEALEQRRSGRSRAGRPFASGGAAIGATLHRLGQLRDLGEISVSTFGGLRDHLLAGGHGIPGLVPGPEWANPGGSATGRDDAGGRRGHPLPLGSR